MIAETLNDTAEPSAMTVPLLEERLRIDTRLVETGRLTIEVAVSQRDETVEALLLRQDISIERVPVGTMIATAPLMRREGDVVIIPVIEERLVTETKLFLVEELRVRIDQSHHLERRTATLRTEHATISASTAKPERNAQ